MTHKLCWDVKCLQIIFAHSVFKFILYVTVNHSTYVVQSIILWIDRIVMLLCITADTWSHEMVPCLFFACPSKKQLHACRVFRKQGPAVKSTCLRAVKIKNVAV
jgi:hypothetical protein